MWEPRTFTRRHPAPIKGTPCGNRLKVSVGFEVDVFQAIKELAKDADISLAEQVRILCDLGIKSLK